MFESQTGDRNKLASLKFAFNFTGSMNHSSDTKYDTLTQELNCGQILQNNGRTIGEFKTEELAYAEAYFLVLKNQKDFGWTFDDFPAHVDPDRKIYTRFRYVTNKGECVTVSQKEEKIYSGVANIKNTKQLEDSMVMMERLGYPEEECVDADGKISNAGYDDLMKNQVEPLKMPYVI